MTTEMSPEMATDKHTYPQDEKAKVAFKHADSNDADEAFKVIQAGETIVLTKEDEKRLLRKIDLHIMPLLCLVYGLNYLDKTSISYASIMGFKVSPYALIHCNTNRLNIPDRRPPCRPAILLDSLNVLLRLPRLRMADQPPAPATAARQVYRFQCHHVGSRPVLP